MTLTEAAHQLADDERLIVHSYDHRNQSVTFTIEKIDKDTNSYFFNQRIVPYELTEMDGEKNEFERVLKSVRRTAKFHIQSLNNENRI